MGGTPTLVDGVLDIPGWDGFARVRFADRRPANPQDPIESFLVILDCRAFHGESRTRADSYSLDPPLSVFLRRVESAGHAKGRWGPWQTPEGELQLTIDHDGVGHYVIGIKLAGYHPRFSVEADAMIESGQLACLVELLSKFLGNTGGTGAAYYTPRG